ncbi:hypothetical protein ACSEE7_14285 [Halomonas cupida]|uniref:hypothetical protein n=1 Tax=Halomonas cupida TaxID=44933 RepID=UPI003EF827A0
MRREEISEDIKELAFDFFYWFSRFEFSLKENKILKSRRVGANAEPGWCFFAREYAESFQASEASRRLLELNPKRQKVGENLDLEWRDVGLYDCNSELCKVVRLLNTIRNNLFHGGKHGAEGWDDIERNKELLTVGRETLDQLARVAGFEEDYTGHY